VARDWHGAFHRHAATRSKETSGHACPSRPTDEFPGLWFDSRQREGLNLRTSVSCEADGRSLAILSGYLDGRELQARDSRVISVSTSAMVRASARAASVG